MTEDRVLEIIRKSDRDKKTRSKPDGGGRSSVKPGRDGADKLLHDLDGWVTDTGGFFLTGWADDRSAPLDRVVIKGRDWSRVIEPSLVGRHTSQGVGSVTAELSGFWFVAKLDTRLTNEEVCAVEVSLADGRALVSEIALTRETASAFEERIARFLAEVRGGDHRLPDDLTYVMHILKPRSPLVAKAAPRHTIESVAVAEQGGVFIAGWVNDTGDAIDEVRVDADGWTVSFAGEALARTVRDDVQSALGMTRAHPFGFWGIAVNTSIDTIPNTCACELVMKSGARERHEVPLKALFDQVELRNLALNYVASSKYQGDPLLEAVACLDRSIGKQIISLNTLISRAIASRPYIQRFASAGAKRKGSIIVCLYGKAEYLSLQNALFSNRPGIEDYEFVYICNSPELADQLLKDARICSKAYGLDLTVVLLPGNAGFGVANNAAVAAARSDRILIVNPDVFPHDRDWAARHSRVVEQAPADQTRLFGVPLYYDDGTIMHAGMYFDADDSVSVQGSGFKQNLTLRVEHYGKGAPPLAREFLRPRPVPAVTGAFISCDRAWFEKLGGFSDEYVMGHYEDADLCLKSIEGGTAPWLHDIKLWHLEGKGSGTRHAVHEGASTVNRWRFNKRWGSMIVPNMLGQRPNHPLLRNEAPSPPDVDNRLGNSLAIAGPATIASNRPWVAPPRQPRAVAPPRLVAGHREMVFGSGLEAEA
jgi:GT2 family glycosyltransferase